ncbi:ATP-binding protein [Legionella bononiensis]|uniref:histidine kinase n=1 Tax=Legionella bononiensis TaxID=2793102 RepID=A0ABS1WDZ8_9GAMM|nr:ATP-binding protein [Legionella bononiensis]MBL7479559.1 response regulator [Legionella bononiensis]MBL7527567.1 response regulator [Legionella bononiensis]
MTILDGHALSMLLHIIQEPLLVLSEEYRVLDINQSAEHKLNIKKTNILGSSLTQICSIHELQKCSSTQLNQITLQIKNYSCLCYAVLVKTLNKKSERSTSKQPHENKLVPADNINKVTFDFLDTIIAEIPVSVYWMNKDYIYLGCSNSMAKLLNLPSRHDIVGKTYADLYDKKSAAFYKKSDKSVIEHGMSLSLEEPLYQPDGTKLIYISKKVPLYDGHGNIMGMLGISTDITERKKMEHDLKLAKEAAEAADRAKTEFIANMGHDIRTPLSGVIGMAELLENSLENEEQKFEAHIIHDSGEELLSMLNDILDDIKAGTINDGEPHLAPFNIHQCVDDLIKLERPTTTTKRLGLFVEMDEAVPQIIISDRKKIQRILLNLLSNAVKFTKSGHITLTIKCVERKKDRVQLQFSVSDTGIGIPKELQTKVFERFYRSSPSYKGIYKGYGLGLHIAKTYVEQLGGHITVISQEGVGSTVQFDLPCHISQNETVQPSKHNKKPASSLSIDKIENANTLSPLCLLIEDNPTALVVLESLITKAGCQFKTATNGEEALNLIKLHHFDLIITDIGLPGISGTEFCALTRTWEQTHNQSSQPIIGLTGHARDAAYDECIASGMNDVFSKPANIELIHSLIKTYITDSSLPKTARLDTTPNSIGIDLPATKEELFQIDQFVLFDSEEALKNCGTIDILKEMLILMTYDLPADLIQMKKAFELKDYPLIEKTAHKIKGGAVYVGTTRLKYACQYVERYWKSGQRELFDLLFQQAVNTIDETIKYIEGWLRTGK